MWLIMRGALDDKVAEIYRFYIVPASNTRRSGTLFLRTSRRATIRDTRSLASRSNATGRNARSGPAGQHRIVAVVPTGSSSASSFSSESAYASSRSGTAEPINLSQDEIRQLQITLNQRGFNVGEPDGCCWR
jgi:hypothetical protein